MRQLYYAPRKAALVISAAVVAAAAAVAVQADPALAVDPPNPVLVTNAPGSVAYLKAEYGVSDEEALRRLNLQLIEPLVDAALAKAYPGDFAGSELDQNNGGVVVIHSTNVTRTQSAVRDVRDAAHIQVVVAKRSLVSLKALATALDAKLNTQGAKNRVAEAQVDIRDNVVAVYQHDGARDAGVGTTMNTAASRERAAPSTPNGKVAQLVAASGDSVVHRQLVVGGNMMKILPSAPSLAPHDTNSCQPQNCIWPMRGGMRLDVQRNTPGPVYPTGDALDATWGECTNAFNVHDERGWVYIMTAGHCTVGPNKSGNTLTFSSHETGRTPVGYEDGNLENANIDGSPAYPNDFAIQPYVTSPFNYSSYWLPSGYPSNLVDSYCHSGEGTQTCTDGNFAMNAYYSYGQIARGWIVCVTGSADSSTFGGYHHNIGYLNGTRCGQVTNLDGGIVTNLCMREGDSGSPLFSELDSRAYGILNGGTSPGDGQCPTNPPGTEWSDYTPLDNAFYVANKQSGHVFGILTN